MDIHTAVLAFLDDMSVCSKHTIRSLSNSLALFERSGVKFNNDVLIEFERWMRERYKESSMRVHISALRTWLAWLDQKDDMPPGVNRAVIEAKLKIARIRKRPKPYAIKQIDPRIYELYDYYDQLEMPDSDYGKVELLRNRAIMKVLFSTGMRLAEVESLTRQAVADGSARETVITGKGDKDRRVYFDHAARKAMMVYCHARSDKLPQLWVSYKHKIAPLTGRGIFHVVKSAAVELRLAANTSPHAIRHWVCEDLLNNDVPVEVVKEFMGHEDIHTTLLYAKASGVRVRKYVMRYQAVKKVVNERIEQARLLEQ